MYVASLYGAQNDTICLAPSRCSMKALNEFILHACWDGMQSHFNGAQQVLFEGRRTC